MSGGSAVMAASTAAVGVLALAVCASEVPAAWRGRHVEHRIAALRGPSTPSLGARIDRVLRRFPRPRSRAAADRARRRARAELLEGVDAIVRSLRVGRTPASAATEAFSGLAVGEALTEALGRGEVLDDAARGWSATTPEVELVALALALSSRLGGAAASVFDGVAGALRDRMALEREVTALAAQARASMMVLVAVPVVALALGAARDRRLLAVVLGSPVGWICVVLGAGLDLLGALWMRRLVRAVLP